jgi:hypothetical protein
MIQVHLVSFLLGLCSMAALAIGLFFWRFWRRTADRLFRIFAIAFWLMSIGWLAQLIVKEPGEASYLVYVPRLLAFSCIIWGIIEKNRAAAHNHARTPPPPPRS